MKPHFHKVLGVWFCFGPIKNDPQEQTAGYGLHWEDAYAMYLGMKIKLNEQIHHIQR